MVEYRDDLTVHIFGDTEPALAHMRASAEACGCRIVSALEIMPGTETWADAVPGAAMLIQLERDKATEAVISLLDRAEREAVHGRRHSIVSTPAALIDLAFARAPHPDVALLCGASEEERRAALSRARRPVPARLHDVGREDGSQILQQLSEDVGRIATMPASMSDQDAAVPAAAERDSDAGYIRAIIRVRRLRDQYFRGDLFADPAWDILLDLMAARLEGRKVAVSSLCIAAAVPATTALRWIKLLTDRGLLVRVADPEDGRRVHIELAEEAARVLGAYLGQARRVFLNMV